MPNLRSAMRGVVRRNAGVAALRELYHATQAPWRSPAIRSGFASSDAAIAIRPRAVGAGVPASLVYAFAFLSNAEIERRPFIDPAFGPHPPAVALDHAPHQGKADTDPLEFILAMQALKYVEQLSAVAHVEPHAVIAHEEHRLPVFRGLRSDPDFRLLMP